MTHDPRQYKAVAMRQPGSVHSPVAHMNVQLLLALLPLALSASRFESTQTESKVASHSDSESSSSVEEPVVETKPSHMAREETVPKSRVEETMQHIKYINSIYGQRVEQLHPLEKLRLLQAREADEQIALGIREEDDCPYSDFELTYGIAGDMLPVYERYMKSLQDRR